MNIEDGKAISKVKFQHPFVEDAVPRTTRKDKPVENKKERLSCSFLATSLSAFLLPSLSYVSLFSHSSPLIYSFILVSLPHFYFCKIGSLSFELWN